MANKNLIAVMLLFVCLVALGAGYRTIHTRCSQPQGRIQGDTWLVRSPRRLRNSFLQEAYWKVLRAQTTKWLGRLLGSLAGRSHGNRVRHAYYVLRLCQGQTHLCQEHRCNRGLNCSGGRSCWAAQASCFTLCCSKTFGHHALYVAGWRAHYRWKSGICGGTKINASWTRS